MSEEKAEYLGEAQEDTQFYIRDEAPHDYYAQIPNIVDEMGLTPHAYRLYGHLRRVAGESGKCWQSTSTLSKACGMSAGKISEAKAELENVYPPLIRIVSKTKDDGRTYHEIYTTDIWAINHEYFANPGSVNVTKGEARSPGETYRSRGESKNNPVVQEELNTGAKNAPLDWKIAHDEPITPADVHGPNDLDLNQVNNIAQLIDMQCRGGGALAVAFMVTRRIVFLESAVKGQRKAARDLLAQGVRPDHIIQAVDQLVSKGMTVTDLYSVSKTAVSIAHPIGEEAYNPQGIVVGV